MNRKRLNPAVVAWFWMLDYAYAVNGQLSAGSDIPFSGNVERGSGPPIVLLPGVYERWQFMRPIVERLAPLDRPIHAVAALGRNRDSVAVAAQVVGEYLVKNELRNVTIVAHSKGGLIGKQLMVLPEFAERISCMVAISTPFSGSVYARFAVSPTIRAFSPRDATTKLLAANLDANARILSIYNAFDPHIPGGCELVGATNIRLPGVGHFRILNDSHLLEAVVEAVVNPS